MDELTLLKEQADKLGITYKANIGLESLKAKIASKLAADAGDQEEEEEDDDTPPAPAKPTKLSKSQADMIERQKQHNDQMKLVRCRIVNLNPAKKDLQGEIFSVQNRLLGTVRKFIPYGEATDNGYHIPHVLYTDLKDRQFVSIKRRKVNGKEVIEQRLVKEFAIEVLEPLTDEELSQLAAQQAAAAGL
jgi:hypothetical protein